MIFFMHCALNVFYEANKANYYMCKSKLRTFLCEKKGIYDCDCLSEDIQINSIPFNSFYKKIRVTLDMLNRLFSV